MAYTLTRINKLLKESGNESRLVRGNGYYYLTNYDGFSSSIPVYKLYDTEDGFQFALGQVNNLLFEVGQHSIGD